MLFTSLRLAEKSALKGPGEYVACACALVPLQSRLVSEIARVDLSNCANFIIISTPQLCRSHLHCKSNPSDRPRWANGCEVLDFVVVGTYTRYQLSIAWVRTDGPSTTTILPQEYIVWAPQKVTMALVMRTSASQNADCSVTLR